MFRAISYLNLLFVLFSIFPQQLSHEVRVVNIAVPVRVYNGVKFVDSLKLEDFEVYEDGNLQPIQAAYYIRNNEVKRGEAPPAPEAAKPEPKPETQSAKPEDEARAAEVAAVLEKTAAYCRKLENAALNFVCNEDVEELFFEAGTSIVGSIQAYNPDEPFTYMSMWNASMAGRRSWEWIYDFLLIRKDGWTQEKRTLVMENGEKRKEENAELKTHRFFHRDVFLGPIGLLSDRAQRNHSYHFVKEGQVGGDLVVVIEATPRERTGASLFGRAWIRKRDGAVVRIEWEPSSMENYTAIEDLALRLHVLPQITFASEYGFEKNGLRFPNVYVVTEAYKGLKTSRGNVLSKTTVTYKDYKFSQVDTSVVIR
jgi:hypothetical protein